MKQVNGKFSKSLVALALAGSMFALVPASQAQTPAPTIKQLQQQYGAQVGDVIAAYDGFNTGVLDLLRDRKDEMFTVHFQAPSVMEVTNGQTTSTFTMTPEFGKASGLFDLDADLVNFAATVRNTVRDLHDTVLRSETIEASIGTPVSEILASSAKSGGVPTIKFTMRDTVKDAAGKTILLRDDDCIVDVASQKLACAGYVTDVNGQKYETVLNAKGNSLDLTIKDGANTVGVVHAEPGSDSDGTYAAIKVTPETH